MPEFVFKGLIQPHIGAYFLGAYFLLTVMIRSSFASPARGFLLAITVAALLGCATRAPLLTQAINVVVDADDPAWGGPLHCKAANSAGNWWFSAPGSITVLSANSPLQITCDTPAGAAAATSTTAPRVSNSSREGAHEGASTGAKVGAGAGVALGVAAAPVMGPAFAVVLAIGSVFKGVQIGGVVGAITSGETTQYPSPILLRIKAIAPPLDP